MIKGLKVCLWKTVFVVFFQKETGQTAQQNRDIWEVTFVFYPWFFNLGLKNPGSHICISQPLCWVFALQQKKTQMLLFCLKVCLRYDEDTLLYKIASKCFSGLWCNWMVHENVHVNSLTPAIFMIRSWESRQPSECAGKADFHTKMSQSNQNNAQKKVHVMAASLISAASLIADRSRGW